MYAWCCKSRPTKHCAGHKQVILVRDLHKLPGWSFNCWTCEGNTDAARWEETTAATALNNRPDCCSDCRQAASTHRPWTQKTSVWSSFTRQTVFFFYFFSSVSVNVWLLATAPGPVRLPSRQQRFDHTPSASLRSLQRALSFRSKYLMMLFVR